jgi:hypothetical protein
MKTGTIIQGTFHPIVRNDLPHEARDLIGSRHYFRVLYRIEGGEYEYRYACEPVDYNGNPTRAFGCVWIPDCDVMIERLDISLPEKMTA